MFALAKKITALQAATKKQQKEMTPNCFTHTRCSQGVISIRSWYLASLINLSFFGFRCAFKNDVLS